MSPRLSGRGRGHHSPAGRPGIHGLVLHPARPQRALLLTGPEASGKTMFHDAMELLLPKGGVVQVPGEFRQD